MAVSVQRTCRPVQRFWAAPSARRRDGGGHFIGVDLGFTDEGHAFLDDEFGGADIAEQLGLGLDFDLLLGVDITVDLAADDDGLGVDIAGDDGGVAKAQHAICLDIAFQLAFKGQFAGELEGAFDLDVR